MGVAASRLYRHDDQPAAESTRRTDFFTPGGSPESGKPEFRKGRHVMLRRIVGEAAEYGALQAAG